MNSWARKSFKVGMLSAGFLIAGAGAAHAAADTTSGNAGIGNGTQVDAKIQAPVDVCGNAVSLLGTAYAGCTGGAWATDNGVDGDLTSTQNFGLLNGTQLRALLQAPIDACGNGVGILGTASAWCTGGSWATHTPAHHPTPRPYDVHPDKMRTEAAQYDTSHNVGVLNGTQAVAPIQIPIDLCGNAIGLLGSATASCTGGAHATLGEDGLPSASTGLNVGLGNGTQLLPILQIPINVCGNAIGILGTAEAHCQGGSDATIGEPAPAPWPTPQPYGDKNAQHGRKHGHQNQHAHKNQHVKKNHDGKPHAQKHHAKGEGLPLVGGLAGLTDLGGVTGNLLGDGLLGGDLLGGGDLTGSAATDRHFAPTTSSCDLHSGANFGVLNGTQALVPVQAPVDISGNAVAALGGPATASSTGGATATLTC
ncbi:chaplin family protein [Hamadaea tsunoensis]|uniref:chaplin family protein n=1 Tax=Hamadaea tsunoensis TaxID=53368 RepID=UPI000402B636|nr:chaplin family protein [Hamadaea tsunoensis]